MTSPSFPAALDARANPGPTTETDDAGYELDVVVARLQNCVMAIEQKLGIGAGGPPASAAVLRRSATGASTWGPVAAGDLVAGMIGCTLIQTTGILAAPLAAASFTGIPATYTSLELRIYGRSTVAGSPSDVIKATLNGATSGYYVQTILGNGAVANGSEQLGVAAADLGTCPGNTAGGGLWGACTAWIHGYSATGNYKDVLSISYTPFSVGANQQYLTVRGSIATPGTAAVTSLSVFPVGGSWAVGSMLTLYGYT